MTSAMVREEQRAIGDYRMGLYSELGEQESFQKEVKRKLESKEQGSGFQAESRTCKDS